MNISLKSLFSTADISKFYKKRNDINILYLSVLYLIPSMLIFYYPTYGSWYFILGGFLVMGAVQHTLATFVHEAAHLNLFTNKKANDFFGHFLCSAPLISYLKDYRWFHFEHHRYGGNFEKDPELKFYRALGIKPTYESKKEVMKVFVNDFTGVSYFRGVVYLLKYFGEKRKQGIIEKPTAQENLCVLFWILLMPVIMWKLKLLIPYLIFWIIPILTFSTLLLRWHGFGEHVREIDGCPSENTLTHQFPLIQTLYLYPINSSYHLEHHLYPQIPWHQLKHFYLWANTHTVYKEKSSHLTVDGFFFGKKTVLNTSFPIRK